MENQAGQYTTEYEILELLKLKLYQQLHGLAPVLGAVKFRIEEPKQPEPNGGVEQESADRACAGFRIDGRVFYLSPVPAQVRFLKRQRFPLPGAAAHAQPLSPGAPLRDLACGTKGTKGLGV